MGIVTDSTPMEEPKDPSKDVPIPPRAVVKFKPGKEMKERVARILPVIQQQEQVDLAD